MITPVYDTAPNNPPPCLFILYCFRNSLSSTNLRTISLNVQLQLSVYLSKHSKAEKHCFSYDLMNYLPTGHSRKKHDLSLLGDNLENHKMEC